MEFGDDFSISRISRGNFIDFNISWRLSIIDDSVFVLKLLR